MMPSGASSMIRAVMDMDNIGKGAYEEVARVKNQEDLDITLRTVQELLDGKIE